MDECRRQPALQRFRPFDDNGPDHLGPHGQIIYVPLQGLSPPTVSGQPGQQVSLGSADVGVSASRKGDGAKLSDTDSPGVCKVEEGDVNTTSRD
jgi:hypothetical protein